MSEFQYFDSVILGRSKFSRMPEKGALINAEIETLQEDLAEKEILLSLNQDFAAASDRNLLSEKIQPRLKQLFGTEDIFICILDDKREQICPLVRMKSADRMRYAEYDELLNSDFEIEDGFINQVLASEEPLIFSLEEMASWKKVPAYIMALLASGLKEALSKTVFMGEKPVGIITCWSDTKGFFNTNHIRLIAKVAGQVSLLVTNLSDHEIISQRERENEVLLEISNEIAAIRKRDDFVPILGGSLKRLLSFDDAVICVFDKARKVYSVYAQHVAPGRQEHPFFLNALNTRYAVEDQLAHGAHIPVVFETGSLHAKGKKQIKFIHDSGIRKFAVIKLADGDELVGNFVLLSGSEKTFTESALKLMQRISYQFSIAVAKLQAFEEIRNREMEKEILLNTGRELAAIRQKEDLLPILKKQLKNLSFYSDVTIAKVDSNQKTFSGFLVNEEPGIRIQNKAYQEMRRAHHRLPDGVF